MDAPWCCFRGIRAGLVALLLAVLGGCAHSGGSLATVPREWRKTNPWGPAAWEARARGTLKPLCYTPQMTAWAEFAREHLQDGDILFRVGVSAGLWQSITDRITTGISDSCFTHDALVIRRGDDILLYDAQPDPQGVRLIPFEFWMLETVPGTLTVKRLRPAYQHYIPQALDYCEQAWARQPHFDSNLDLDDERLYCSEMIEKAFRSAGLTLSEPIPICCLPRYPHYQCLAPLARVLAGICTDEPVFALGNACYGSYGSPCLELIKGGDLRLDPKPPLCSPTPFVADAKGSR
jgi:hypothetical protein